MIPSEALETGALVRFSAQARDYLQQAKTEKHPPSLSRRWAHFAAWCRVEVRAHLF